MRALALLAAIVLGVCVSACGSSSGSSSAAQPTRGTTTVAMSDLAYHPAALSAKVGQTITFVNHDGPPHNVTYLSGPKFSSSPIMTTGATWHLKLTQPGTIHYFCSVHPFMKGTLVVTK